MNDECAQVLLPLLGGEGRGEGGIAVHGSWKETNFLTEIDIKSDPFMVVEMEGLGHMRLVQAPLETSA